MSEPSIQAKNLTKSFGNLTAVKNLNLEIYSGEIFAFLGPNGAGKTTVVKLFSGLLKPSSGEVFVCNHNVQKESLIVKKIVGLLPDHPFVYPKLSGLEFLQLVGDIYDVPKEEQETRIPELMAMFDLSDFAEELMETYSNGMRQKVLLASILLRKPKVMLLDEPLVGLDPKSVRLVKDIFVELSKRGITIFMCTHILEIAEKLAQRIGILYQGELIALGTKDELKEKLSHKSELVYSRLEDIYLNLTGGSEYAELMKYL